MLRRLFEHMVWADERVLEGLRTAPGGDEEALVYLAHVLAAEHVWISRIVGLAPEHAVWPSLSLEECAALAARNGREYEALLDQLDAAGVDRQIAYRNSAGQAFVTRL